MSTDITVTILNPTTIRIVADGVADATLNVPDAARAAAIAIEEFKNDSSTATIREERAA